LVVGGSDDRCASAVVTTTATITTPAMISAMVRRDRPRGRRGAP
jgi:hypothetical protein